MSVSHDEPITKLTYDDYVHFPDDGNRHEIINGRHYMNAAPNPRHQTVSRLIQFQLMEQIEIPGHGQVFNAPIDLQLSNCDVVQPDIVVVRNEQRIVTPTKILGVPDLVIEILSPSTRGRDEQLKKQLYEQRGIPEYWIVDADSLSVQQYLLTQEKVYDGGTVCTDEICFRSSSVTATVDLNKVW